MRAQCLKSIQVGDVVVDLRRFPQDVVREWLVSQQGHPPDPELSHVCDRMRPSLPSLTEDLQCDYLDLYMIHWPVPEKHLDAYKAGPWTFPQLGTL